MSLNIAELNTFSLNDLPYKEPVSVDHTFSLIYDFTFSTALAYPPIPVEYDYFVAQEVFASECLPAFYDYFVPTSILHFGAAYKIAYAYFVPTTEDAVSGLYVVTDFTPYDVVTGIPAPCYYDMAALGFLDDEDRLTLSYIVSSTVEINFISTLAWGIGVLRDSRSVFDVYYFLYDYDPFVIDLAWDVGVLTQFPTSWRFGYDIGVLTLVNGDKRIPAAYTMGVLHDFTAMLGMAFDMYPLTLTASAFSVSYWVKNHDYTDVLFSYDIYYPVDRVQFTLSWEKINTQFGGINLYYDSDYPSGISAFTLAYTVERHILVEVVIPLGDRVIQVMEVGLGINSYARAGVDIRAGLFDKVRKGVEVGCSLGYVSRGFDVGSPLYTRVVSRNFDIDAPYLEYVRSIFNASLPLPSYARAGSVITLPLPILSPVKGGVRMSVPMITVAEIITTSPLIQLTVGSTIVSMDKGTITADEGSYPWRGTFVLSNPRDLSLFTVSANFTVLLGTDSYSFVVESKTNKRTSPATLEATVIGISPSAQLDEPRALPVTNEWSASVMTRSIAEEVADGYPMLWQILDWPLPAHRYSVSLITPYTIIQQLAATVGGTVDSLPDGTLRVRPKYPVSVPNYGPAVTTHTYVEGEHTFESTEEYAPVREYDMYRIRDLDADTKTDTLEYIEDTTHTGTLRVYPGPWREDFIIYSSAHVYIGSRGYETRQETEVLEIVDGRASTKYPVTSVVSVEWLDTDLSGVTAGDDSRTVLTQSTDLVYSMVRMVYTTRYFTYSIIGAEGKYAQFIMENL